MPYPFDRANALGFAMFENFTSAQATLIDTNAAAAADGSIWSDIALVKNLLPLQTGIGGSDIMGDALVWEPTVGQWFLFGTTTAGIATVYRSFVASADWLTTTLSSDVTDTDWGTGVKAATNGAGKIVAVGPAGAAFRVRQSQNAGTSWARAANSNATGATGFSVWMPSASLFANGFGNTSNTNLETSVDGTNGTWNVRTAPNTNGRSAAAANAVRCVVLSITNTDKCITSEDGITWTERTLPSSAVWATITWSSQRALFMVTDGTGKFATSPDGIAWTSVTTSGPTATEPKLRAIGRLWLMMGSNWYRVSFDDGVTWKILANFSQTTGYQFELSPAQSVFAYANTVRASLQGGF